VAPKRGSSGGWWPQGGDDDEPAEKRNETGEGEEPERRPPRGLETPGTRKSSARYSAFVGAAFVAIIVIALINLVNDDDSGILGVSDADAGLPLAEFAVPDAAGSLPGDANVAQDDCESSLNPCPSDQSRTPACEIDAMAGEAIRVCDLFDKPLAISFWFTRGGDCLGSQDAFDDAAARYGGRVNFLSVNVRDTRETVRSIVDERGWRVPVGLDADGAVSNLYRVGVCPTIVLAYPGGILYRAQIKGGNLDSGEVNGIIADLLAASRERAEASR